MDTEFNSDGYVLIKRDPRIEGTPGYNFYRISNTSELERLGEATRMETKAAYLIYARGQDFFVPAEIATPKFLVGFLSVIIDPEIANCRPMSVAEFKSLMAEEAAQINAKGPLAGEKQ